ALEAEGDRACAYRVDPIASVAPRWHGPRTATPFVRLHLPAQEASGRAALGAGVEVRGRQAHRGECVRCKRAQDEGFPRGARQAEGGEDRAAGGSSESRQPESGAQLTEYCRQRIGGQQPGASVSLAAL